MQKASLTYAIKQLTIHKNMCEYFCIQNVPAYCDDAISVLKSARRKIKESAGTSTNKPSAKRRKAAASHVG